MATQDRLHRWS